MPLRWHRLIVLVFFLLLTLGVGAFYLQGDDAATVVHEAVLESLSHKIPISEFSFYSHPSTCRGTKKSSWPELSKELFAAFLKQNDVRQPQPQYLNITKNKYHIISKEDSRHLYAGKVPQLEGIPKQLINLSHIGFNPSGTLALLCVESTESTDLVYLQKVDGVWQIRKWFYIW